MKRLLTVEKLPPHPRGSKRRHLFVLDFREDYSRDLSS